MSVHFHRPSPCTTQLYSPSGTIASNADAVTVSHAQHSNFDSIPTHGHYVSNVLVFTPNGVIVMCAINAPGAMHDSLIAEWGGVYAKLEDVFKQLELVVWLIRLFRKEIARF
ncbi:hypothetical protein PHYSODRAFT_305597 [Phytophthora sojae]|uniref:DDE Tnp4 domain-containing protein n=1 Tax=Phytophthora sojae (strain P6497) TaxID=1094619 RepID=G5A5S3_PHYSP|nr:hypothetical protein PHYSODRAFT_305597 [Phytophthora sojae]EGZ08678.1 hypothetical protein PHYSODRAFT_305597 [Phytophthora sojae]|eukprot:XP_009535311.1 hypothetical protein PHYSODRAFT_305597 [Phytophthora sojae]